jgi:leader peptidase (prepilin peptidase)/N-methyltransferase
VPADLAWAAAALAPGLVVGSFVNVVAARVPLRLSVVAPRSFCFACRQPIAWYDNVPLVSYAVLRGRCRHCGASISVRYPLVELATALLSAGCVLAFGLSWLALLAAAFCATLVAISAADLEHRIVPNRIVLPAAVVALAGRLALDLKPEWPLAGLGAAAFLLLAVLVYPQGMGMGDVKLALLLGFMLGKSVTVALMLGFVAGLAPAAVLLARHGRAARKMAIPLAPFLALGAVVALFWGPDLLHWYWSLR